MVLYGAITVEIAYKLKFQIQPSSPVGVNTQFL